MFPTITEYNQAIQVNGSNAFRTLNNLEFIPSRLAPIKIYTYGSGSYAVVFKARESSSEFAIRCFINAAQENSERYQILSNYLMNLNVKWLVNFVYLENEICINKTFYSVVKMDWVNGKLLNNYISDKLFDNFSLTELQSKIVELSQSLEELNVGHGDIQCGNLLISQNSKSELNLKLIDYDGMYIPPFQNKINLERGRSEFQHPFRNKAKFDEKIDRFSFWVILCAIEAIKFDKSLWSDVLNGGYNTHDNLLFRAEDFLDTNKSELIKRLSNINQPSLNIYLKKLVGFCNSHPNDIEAPFLNDGTMLFSASDNSPFLEHHSRIITITSSPSGAFVNSNNFQKIGVTPISIDLSIIDFNTIYVLLGTQIKTFKVDSISEDLHVNFISSQSADSETASIPPSTIETEQTPQSNNVQTINSTPLYSVLGVLVISFVIVLLTSIYIYSKKNYNESPIIENYDSLTVDTAAAVVDTAAATVDTIFSESKDEIQSSRKDDSGSEPTETVKKFFQFLSINDCNEAWDLTLNPKWEEKQKDWFCSFFNIGYNSSIRINSIYTDSNTPTTETLFVDYVVTDATNYKKCYKQYIELELLMFPNNISKWMIINTIDIVQPYDCY